MTERTYIQASHAMQSGVATMMGLDPRETNPKHLRVGINVALRDHASLFELLIKKGIITEEEYRKAITAGMNKEVEDYENKLSVMAGRKIRLG